MKEQSILAWVVGRVNHGMGATVCSIRAGQKATLAAPRRVGEQNVRVKGRWVLLLLCYWVLFLSLPISIDMKQVWAGIENHGSFGIFRLFLMLSASHHCYPQQHIKPNVLSCCWLCPGRVMVPTVIFPIAFLGFAVLLLLPELCYLSRLNPGQILFQYCPGLSRGSISLVKLMTCVLPPRPSFAVQP